MLTTTNYKFKKPELTDSPPDITVMNDNWDIIDTNLKKLNDDKAPKDVATTSKEGLMSKADKSKLDGIASGANNYSHPTTHPASMIAEDSTHRFLTDVERELIQAWETFKTTGGTIEGALKVVGLLTLEGYSTSATGGYTKLPNGFMLQWGDFTTAGINANSEINPQRVFPVAFPSTTLIVAPFVKKCVSDLGATLNAEVVIKAVTINNKSAFQTKIKAKEYVSGGVVVGYIALGR